MTSWPALGVLMLVSFSKAGIFSIELDNQIKEGIKRVNASEELVRKEVEEVNREINKVSLYFSLAVNINMVEGEKIYKNSNQEVEKIIIEKFEEGIDKGKNITVLLYLLETMKTTENELDGEYDIFKSCLKNVLAQKSNKLQKLKNVFEFTETFSSGFYNGLRSKMKNCQVQECIIQLVHAAETKKKNLTNMFKKYVAKTANINAELQEGHKNCIGDAQKNFRKVLKVFENDMEYIPTTQGTDDFTDRIDCPVA